VREHRLRVFENMVLWKIFRPMRGDVMGQWRRLHYGEFYDPSFAPDVIWVVKPRRM